MLTISQFFGIIIRMFFDDQNPPHFHAKYGNYEAEILIENGKIKEGSLPKTAAKLVEEWRKLHAAELMANWEKAKNLQLPDNIEPLE